MTSIQMAVGYCFDVMKLTSGRRPVSLSISRSTTGLKDKNRGPQGYWQSRRKTYQEMVDNLYVKYMEKLVVVQQQQSQYWNMDSQYIYPQARYSIKDGRNDEYYSQYANDYDSQYANDYDYYDDDDELMIMDNGEGSGDRNYDETNSDEISEESSFMQDMKITEHTSKTNMG
jgi:hypothetical protein